MLRSYTFSFTLSAWLWALTLNHPNQAQAALPSSISRISLSQVVGASLQPADTETDAVPEKEKPKDAGVAEAADKSAVGEGEAAAPDSKKTASNSSPDNPYKPGTAVAKIYDLGEEQLKAKDFKQAKETFRALAYKRPQDPVPMLRIAVVCARAGDLDEALVWTKKAVAFDPGDVEAHLQLAHLLDANQELVSAALQYETAYSCATGEEKIRVESVWVRALIKCGQLDKANKVTFDVCRTNHGPEALYNRAWVLSQVDKESSKEEAIKTYRKILDIDPGRHDARFNLASLFAQMGRKEEAIAEFQQFVQDAPQDPDAARAKTLITKLQASK